MQSDNKCECANCGEDYTQENDLLGKTYPFCESCSNTYSTIIQFYQSEMPEENIGDLYDLLFRKYRTTHSKRLVIEHNSELGEYCWSVGFSDGFWITAFNTRREALNYMHYFEQVFPEAPVQKEKAIYLKDRCIIQCDSTTEAESMLHALKNKLTESW